jgi:hypothetical protein
VQSQIFEKQKHKIIDNVIKKKKKELVTILHNGSKVNKTLIAKRIAKLF